MIADPPSSNRPNKNHLLMPGSFAARLRRSCEEKPHRFPRLCLLEISQCGFQQRSCSTRGKIFPGRKSRAVVWCRASAFSCAWPAGFNRWLTMQVCPKRLFPF